MANEFIARNGVIAQNNSIVSGSLTVTQGITGSLLGTSSYAVNGLSSSFASTASFTLGGSGTFSGSFSGSGANLFNIPASGITGLNLSQISSGSVSASISPSNGLQVNTNVIATSFTGSLSGSIVTATTYNNLPTASATTDGIITTGSQTIAGSKTFTSQPTIPANGGNSGQGAIIIDNGSGLLQVAYNGIYPNLTELQTVKGVTSSIQVQLDSKPSSTALIKKVLSNTVATAAVSGTTLQTLIYSAPVILGGTFSFNDFFNFQATFRKQPQNAITCTYRFYVSNTNNFATASLLATWATVRFNTVVERKNIFFKANGTINTPLLPSTTAQTDITNQDTAVTSLAVDPADDIYFFVSVQFSGIGDNVQMTAIKIQN